MGFIWYNMVFECFALMASTYSSLIQILTSRPLEDIVRELGEDRARRVLLEELFEIEMRKEDPNFDSMYKEYKTWAKLKMGE
jgi:hypothetical protein